MQDHTVKRPYLAALALVVTAVALLPPMHGLSHDLFSWHMVQHLVLVFGVAPLLALALPERIRDVAGSRFLLGPLFVVILHAIALWAWHLPILYDAALDIAPLHALEHASFVATGTLFWFVVAGRSRIDHLRRAAMVFVTGLQSAALGALLAFASSTLYDSHISTASQHGLTPLEDQQLAGGIMWVPPGIVYLVITLALFLGWMKHAGQNDAAVAADRGPS